MSMRAAFLDRDGIINKDTGYVFRQDQFIWNDHIFEDLLDLQTKGYSLFIITNQSGIARGYYNEQDFKELTDWMLGVFEQKQIYIKKVYHCPHLDKDNCNCRKPKPGMILQAQKEFDIDLQNSILVGDKDSDLQAGRAAGIKNVYKSLRDIL